MPGPGYVEGVRRFLIRYHDAGLAVTNLARGADDQGAGPAVAACGMEGSDVERTAGTGNWQRIGVLLHRISYGKIAFYLVGFFYQVKAMFFSGSSRSLFVNNLVFSLMMYGFAMAFEGLRDTQHVTEHERRSILKYPRMFRTTVLCGILGFVFAVVLGLYLLFRVKDQFQGVAIISFGFGGLTLMRTAYDRQVFVHGFQEARGALAQPRDRHALGGSTVPGDTAPVATPGEALPEVSGPPGNAGSRGCPPQAG